MSELSHKRARWLIQRKRLSPEERSRLGAHLARCDECREYAAIHMMLARDLQLAPVRTRPSPALRAAVLSRVDIHQRREQIMNPIRTLAAVAVLAVVVFFAWQTIGGSVRQAAVAEPEAATPLPPTSEAPPTRTPRPTLTPLATRFQDIDHQITTAEELVGVYGYQRWGGNHRYFLFGPDGTYSIAGTLSRERLEDTPAESGEFWFEDTRLHLLVLDNRNEATECIDVVGLYEVQLLTNGALRFEVVEDECRWHESEFPTFDFEPVELPE